MFLYAGFFRNQKEKEMKNKYLKNLAGLLALATLAACGGSSSCPPNGATGNLTLKNNVCTKLINLAFYK
jgi:hypothetical protein